MADEVPKSPGPFDVRTIKSLVALMTQHDLAEIESFASHIGFLDRGRLQFSEEMSALAERFREVEVTVREEDSTMLVEVADSGPGMAPETLARAMTRGWSTKAEHHGLGLALVAQVVARYGGTLRTEPSLGSLIVAEIPLERPGSAP